MDIYSNKSFKEYAIRYLEKSENYSSYIINALELWKKADIKELSDFFDSKPSFYSAINILKKRKIIEYKNNNIYLSGSFKKALDFYSLKYKLLDYASQNWQKIRNANIKNNQ